MQSESVRRRSGPAATAGELLQVVLRIRRVTRLRLRAEWGSPPLPEAQLEVLRLVRDRPGLRVQEAAEALGVAPNTVSTLVRQLQAGGLLERRADTSDGRVIRLHLTRAAQARLARWRDRRQTIVAVALASLPEADRRAVEAALPALGRLVDALAEDEP